MKRAALWALLVVGTALVVLPIATGMFGKASAGQEMITAFKPVMDRGNVQTSTQYYGLFRQVGADFTPIMTEPNVARFRGYLTGMSGMSKDMDAFLAAFASANGMTQAQVQQMLATRYPAMAQMLESLPAMQRGMGGMVGIMSKDVRGFGQITPALAHFGQLLQTMRGQVGNFQEVASLPPMGLLPWFFVGPGALIALLWTIRRRPAVELVESEPALAA